DLVEVAEERVGSIALGSAEGLQALKLVAGDLKLLRGRGCLLSRGRARRDRGDRRIGLGADLVCLAYVGGMVFLVFFLMIRRPPSSTRLVTLFPTRRPRSPI